VKVSVEADPANTETGVKERVPEPSGEALTVTLGEEPRAVSVPPEVDSSFTANVTGPTVAGGMALAVPPPEP
jgi:hypothetical protein